MLTRRHVLGLLGAGAASAALPAALAPERRIWQVPSNAPVGSRLERGFVLVERKSRNELMELYERHMEEHIRAIVHPEPIHLAPLPTEWTSHVDHVRAHVESLSGLNSVARSPLYDAWTESAKLLDEDVFKHLLARLNEAKSAGFLDDRGGQNSAIGGETES